MIATVRKVVKNKKIWACVLAVLCFSFHKFYMSVTQIEYVESQQAVQIISRVFIDDIEDVIEERYETNLFLNTEKENINFEQLLEQYIRKKFEVYIDEEKQEYTFIGKEYEEDMLVFYLEIKEVTALRTIRVQNSILMDLFDEQQNIIHVKKGGSRQSLLLSEGESSGVLNFRK